MLVIIAVALVDGGRGYFLSTATAFSVMQLFATYGLVSLGLGLSLLVREFDISTAGMVTLAGAVAVFAAPVVVVDGIGRLPMAFGAPATPV